jgi:hypothetical protein
MTSTTPTIEVLYFQGCPHHRRAVALLRRALADEGIAAPIRLIRVETEAQARRVGFHGSPSIRIDGEDVAPVPEGVEPGLLCRVYRLPDGRLAPVPAYETLAAALRRRR